MPCFIVSNIPVGKFCQSVIEEECPYYIQNIRDGYCIKEREIVVDKIKVCGINREKEEE